MPFLRIMNPGVCTMSLFVDYVTFCAKVEGQGVTLTFDTHVASLTHLVENKHVPRLTFIWGVKNGKVNQRTIGPVSLT